MVRRAAGSSPVHASAPDVRADVVPLSGNGCREMDASKTCMGIGAAPDSSHSSRSPPWFHMRRLAMCETMTMEQPLSNGRRIGPWMWRMYVPLGSAPCTEYFEQTSTHHFLSMPSEAHPCLLGCAGILDHPLVI
jgi:hypothetical protein